MMRYEMCQRQLLPKTLQSSHGTAPAKKVSPRSNLTATSCAYCPMCAASSVERDSGAKPLPNGGMQVFSRKGFPSWSNAVAARRVRLVASSSRSWHGSGWIRARKPRHDARGHYGASLVP